MTMQPSKTSDESSIEPLDGGELPASAPTQDRVVGAAAAADDRRLGSLTGFNDTAKPQEPLLIAPGAEAGSGNSGRNHGRSEVPGHSSEVASSAEPLKPDVVVGSQRVTDYEFDANALVEPGSDIDYFDRRRDDALKRIFDKTSKGEAAWKPSDFSAFDDGGKPAPNAKVEFTLDRRMLYRTISNLCVAAGLKAGGRRNAFYGVRLCLSDRYVTLTVSHHGTLFRRRLWTDAVEGIADGQQIGIWLNLRQLKRLGRALFRTDDAAVNFRYEAAKKWLIVRSDRARPTRPFRIRLDAFQQEESSDYGETLQKHFGSPVHLHEVNLKIVREAVRFGRLFAERDPTRPYRPQVRIADGVARALSADRAGELASDKFGELVLLLMHQQVDLLLGVLSDFASTGTHLFDTPSHHVFHDGEMCLAVPKGHDRSWPDVGPKWYQPYRSKILVDRATMRTHLERLAAVPAHDGLGRSFLVTMRVEGDTSEALLSLHASDGDHSNGLTVVRCSRLRGEGVPQPLPNCMAIVPLQTLHEVISYFDSANVIIEEMPSGILRIQDESADFKTTAWLMPMRPQADRPKEKKRIGVVRYQQP